MNLCITCNQFLVCKNADAKIIECKNYERRNGYVTNITNDSDGDSGFSIVDNSNSFDNRQL